MYIFFRVGREQEKKLENSVAYKNGESSGE
jgi:hypothetical protein